MRKLLLLTLNAREEKAIDKIIAAIADRISLEAIQTISVPASGMIEPIINEIDVKSVLTKSNLPVCEYSVTPYVGCTHACKYCYASFMKRFTGHTESWGTFLDVKHWKAIKNPGKYKGKELFIGSVTDTYNPKCPCFMVY